MRSNSCLKKIANTTVGRGTGAETIEGMKPWRFECSLTQTISAVYKYLSVVVR